MPTVLITGANRGLGLEFARQYLADGWKVVATAREPDKAAELMALGKIEILPLDVSSGESVAALAKSLNGRPLEHIVSNAGIYGPKGKGQTLEGMDYQGWLDTFAANTLGPFRLTVALKDNLLASKKDGATPKLAFLSSLMGSIADSSGGNYVYRSSKAALNMVGHGIALELKEQGIVTLLLHPGWVQTDMGGPQAPLKPADSIRGMRMVIATASIAHSGRFLDYTGKELPW